MDVQAPRTKGIQRSTSKPGALAEAIAAASPVARSIAARATGMDGGHNHADGDGDGGGHEHEHVTSRLMNHEGRIANLEGKSDGDGDGK